MRCAIRKVHCLKGALLITNAYMNAALILLALVFSPFSLAQETQVLIEPIVVLGSDLEKTSTPLVSAPGSFVETDSASLRARVPRSLRSSLGSEPNILFNGAPRPNTEQPQIRASIPSAFSF